MELPFSTVKKFTMAKTTDAQIQPEAVEMLGVRLQEIAQEIGHIAFNVAQSDGRKRIMREHMQQALESYLTVKVAEKRLAAVKDGSVETVPLSEVREKRGNVGSKAEQLLAMANRDLIKLGKKPYLLGSAKE